MQFVHDLPIFVIQSVKLMLTVAHHMDHMDATTSLNCAQRNALKTQNVQPNIVMRTFKYAQTIVFHVLIVMRGTIVIFMVNAHNVVSKTLIVKRQNTAKGENFPKIDISKKS